MIDHHQKAYFINLTHTKAWRGKNLIPAKKKKGI